ncbi:MAG: Clp protease N-terminal domain-containing protein [Streptosporangiaceae bacterium]|nr:Clp protease N-terminal domain-containing protein [Streptosporangiaceae bacterium]MBV9857053.1 Clp protease N-terminal domain-containing protein [Streptosporangiaceae bacterium]
MAEPFDLAARTVIVRAQLHARRLGHHYIGREHFLLAMALSEEPAGTVLRAHGLTPEMVEELIVARAALGAGAGLFADLDLDALAAAGIDIEAVQARVTAQLGPEALARADRAVHNHPRPPGRAPLSHRAAAWLLRPYWRRRARRAGSSLPEPVPIPTGVPGRYQAADPPPPGYIPFTPGARQTLQCAHSEAAARHDPSAGAEHIALALTTAVTGPVPAILSAAGATAPGLRAAIQNRYRHAS